MPLPAPVSPQPRTRGAWGVDGLVSLDEEVAALKADQHHLLHHGVTEGRVDSHELVPIL